MIEGSVSSTTLAGAVDSEFTNQPPLTAEIACIDLMALVAVFDKPKEKRRKPPPPILEVVIPEIPLIRETPKEAQPKPKVPLAASIEQTFAIVRHLLQPDVPPKCCCCVQSLTMTAMRFPTRSTPYSLKNFKTDQAYVEAKGALFGHVFFVKCALSYEAGITGSTCSMQWSEWCDNWPPKVNLPNNTWVNVTHQLDSIVGEHTFVAWDVLATPPCPQGGSQVVADTDQALGGPNSEDTLKGLNQNYHRLLKIRVTVSSGAGCPCASAGQTLAWQQELEIKEGKITKWDWEYSS